MSDTGPKLTVEEALKRSLRQYPRTLEYLSARDGSSDRAKVQAMRDANWTPASTYWRLRAEAAEEAREMAVCHAFSAGYEAGQRDAATPPKP